MYYEGLVEHWWVGDGYKCPGQLLGGHPQWHGSLDVPPSLRAWQKVSGMTDEDLLDWVNAPPHRGLNQLIAIPNHLQKTPNSIKTESRQQLNFGA